jgi:DNA topoisomerase-1
VGEGVLTLYRTIEDYLKKAKVEKGDEEEYKKYIATLANLEAAIVCNHKRSLPKNWKKSLEKKIETLEKLKRQKIETRRKLENKLEERMRKFQERMMAIEEKIKKSLEAGKDTKALEERMMKLKKEMKDTREKMERNLKEKMEKFDKKIEKMKLKIDATKKTRDYNLNTSLKSYIDPRAFYRWFKQVDFDWKKYYPKSLQRKFSWIEEA